MTADYTKLAVYDVTDAIWRELQGAGILSSNDYFADGFNYPLTPIFPAQQIPEMNNLLPGKPYITYDISQRNYGVQWWIQEESIFLEIISRNAGQIQTIINFLIDVFRRYDESARDVNINLVNGSPFKFLFFNLETADPVQPFTDEGGYMSGTLSIRYSYVRDLDHITGRFA